MTSEGGAFNKRLLCRKDKGKGLADKITALVNETISEEASAGPNSLSQDDVLALIDSGNSQGGSEGYHWVLDPIDGTRGFVGMRQYAVCLGLIHKGKVRCFHPHTRPESVRDCPACNTPSGMISHMCPE